MRPARSVLVVLVPLALLSVLACGKKKSADPAPEPAPTPAPAPSAPGGPASRMNFGTDEQPMTLLGRLTYEAQHRPAGVLRAEDVVAALKEAGIELSGPQQVLGMSVRAAYCVTGATKAGTGVTVCEYPSDTEAAAGREYSLEKMAAMKNRLLSVRRGTLLTVTTTVEPPESDVEAKKIVGVFEKL